MTDPGLALQGAIVGALKRDGVVRSWLGDRVFDRAPETIAFPHAEIDEVQVVDDGADGLEGAAEVFVTLHVWTRPADGSGKRDGEIIAGAIRDRLHLARLVLAADLDLVEIMHRDTRVFLDADGITGHGVLVFRALVDPVT